MTFLRLLKTHTFFDLIFHYLLNYAICLRYTFLCSSTVCICQRQYVSTIRKKITNLITATQSYRAERSDSLSLLRAPPSSPLLLLFVDESASTTLSAPSAEAPAHTGAESQLEMTMAFRRRNSSRRRPRRDRRSVARAHWKDDVT